MARPTRSAQLQAYTDLLDLPVVLAGQSPESFERILRYESELRDWFRIYPGWQIERNRELIRLVRIPAQASLGPGTGRPVLDHPGPDHWGTGRPGLGLPRLSEPLDYLLFTLVLYLAEELAARGGRSATIGDRFLLSFLAEDLIRLAQSNFGEEALDFGQISHRRSLQRVMTQLEELGALVRLDGSANEWADRSASADGLYAFTDVTARLLAGSLPPPDAEQRLWRTLLMDPILLAYNDPEAYALLLKKQTFIGRELYDLFGWHLDVRKGMARVLREGHAQGAGYVLVSARHRGEYGPVLLLCGRVQDLVAAGELTPDQRAGIALPYSQFCDLLLELREEHRDSLAAGLGSCSPDELVQRCLTLMLEVGFARRPSETGEVYLTPLVALYRGYFNEPTPVEEETHAPQLRLFD